MTVGVDLTKQLFARHAADLTAGELVVLGYMCLVALDKENGKGQPAGLYFGGWEPLALALGYDELTPAAKEKVRRSVKGIREKGLVKPMVAHAQTGERQVYRITFARTGAQLPSPYRATGSEPQEGHNFRGDRGSESEPPRTELGQTEDLHQDTSITSVTKPQSAREAEDANNKMGPHKFQGDAGGDCTACGRSYLDRTTHPLRLIQERRRGA
jgi:hypothetical protein